MAEIRTNPEFGMGNVEGGMCENGANSLAHGE
jgi:hypothetical protein